MDQFKLMDKSVHVEETFESMDDEEVPVIKPEPSQRKNNDRTVNLYAITDESRIYTDLYKRIHVGDVIMVQTEFDNYIMIAINDNKLNEKSGYAMYMNGESIHTDIDKYKLRFNYDPSNNMIYFNTEYYSTSVCMNNIELKCTLEGDIDYRDSINMLYIFLISNLCPSLVISKKELENLLVNTFTKKIISESSNIVSILNGENVYIYILDDKFNDIINKIGGYSYKGLKNIIHICNTIQELDIKNLSINNHNLTSDRERIKFMIEYFKKCEYSVVDSDIDFTKSIHLLNYDRIYIRSECFINGFTDDNEDDFDDEENSSFEFDDDDEEEYDDIETLTNKLDSVDDDSSYVIPVIRKGR